jgi:hypothetical protein
MTVLSYHDGMGKKRVASSRRGMVVTTVALDPELHRRLALAALEEHAAVVELIRDAIRDYLARRPARRKGKDLR